MSKSHIFFLLFFCFGACKSQQTVTPESFYFKSVLVNNQQSGGFQYGNVNLLPKMEISFSVPLNTESAKKNIALTEKLTAINVPLNFIFSKNDSTVQLTPSQALKHISKYELVVNSTLQSKENTPLNTDIRVGVTTQLDTTDKFPRISDEELLTLVQKQTFKYFWDFGHPASGLSRERNTSGDVVTLELCLSW
jgi:hypothetical protein